MQITPPFRLAHSLLQTQCKTDEQVTTWFWHFAGGVEYAEVFVVVWISCCLKIRDIKAGSLENILQVLMRGNIGLESVSILLSLTVL